MPRPSILLSPTTTLFLLTCLTTSVLAAPFPKGGGGHGGGGGGGGGHSSSGGSAHSGGSGGSSSSGDDKPLSKGAIAGIVVGVFFGTLLVLAVAFICTNIDWCIKKEYEFYDWQARRKAKKEGTQRGYAVAETQEGEAVVGDGEDVKEREWDEGATDVSEAREEDGYEEEYTDAVPTYAPIEEGELKAQVQVRADSVSEITQVNPVDEDVDHSYTGAPEVQYQSRSWRDRLAGKWT